MKDINPSFKAVATEMLQALRSTARFGARTLKNMSWPALMLSCVALAMVITIVPLAIFLFAVFLLLKVLIGLAFFSGRRQPPHANGRAR